MVHFRKVGDRNVSHEVVLMKVNPKMDILALVLQNGDIVLHRLLTWQRVLHISKPKLTIPNNNATGDNKNVMVIDFEWSPDGKFLAAAYNGYFEPEEAQSRKYSFSGYEPKDKRKEDWKSSIALYDIDANKIVSTQNLSLTVKCLYWNSKGSPGDCGAEGDGGDKYENDVADCNESSDNSDKATNKTSFSSNNNKEMPVDTLNIPYIDLFADEEDFQNFLAQNSHSIKIPGGIGSTSSSVGSGGGDKSKKAKSYLSRKGFLSKYSSSADDFSNYDKMSLFGQNGAFSVLLAGTCEGIVQIFSFGLYKLLRIDVRQLFEIKKLPLEDQNLEIDQLWISNDLNLISLNVNSSSNNKRLLTFECKLLSLKCREIYVYTLLKSYLDTRLEFLHHTLKEISSIWEDLIAEVDSKLSNYVSSKEDIVSSQNNDDSTDDISMATNTDPFAPRSNKIKLEPNEFIEMLVFGEISMNLERFLTDLTEKGLKKLASTIELSFIEIHKLNINKLQRALFHIYSFLIVLKGILLHDVQFGDLCLSVYSVNLFLRETSALLIKSIEMQQNLSDSMKKTKAFIRWLHKCVHMVTSSSGSSGSSGHGDSNRDSSGPDHQGQGATDGSGTITTLSTQDLHLIMDFLRENSITNGFKFENIGYYLRTGAEQRNQSVPRIFKYNGSGGVQAQQDKTDSAKIPYKEFLKEKQLSHFLEQLKQLRTVNHDEVVEEDEAEILRLFFPDYSAVSELDRNIFLNDPIDEDVSSWKSMIFNDCDDIDLLSDRVYERCSLYEHLYRVRRTFNQTFDDSSERMNQLQLDQFKISINDKFCFQFPSFEFENRPLALSKRIDYYCNSFQNEFYLSLVSTEDIECDEEESPKCSLLFLFCMKLSQSKNLEESQQIKSILARKLQFKSKCFRLCQCQERIQLTIDDCKFYGPTFLTMILSEQHHEKLNQSFVDEDCVEESTTALNTKKESTDDGIAADDDLVDDKQSDLYPDTDKIKSSDKAFNNRYQYLVQFSYRRLLRHSTLSQDDKPIEIDLTSKIESVLNCAENQPKVLNEEEGDKMEIENEALKSDIVLEKADSLTHENEYDNLPIIVRFLGESQLNNLAVSGSRKLACLSTAARARISTFEMDVSEDEEEEDAEDEEDDEEDEGMADAGAQDEMMLVDEQKHQVQVTCDEEDATQDIEDEDELEGQEQQIEVAIEQFPIND